MKIILTGSLGHISKPLAQQLIKKGHTLTIISSNADRKQEIEELGAKASIGNMEDENFMATAFIGADIVYAMETLGSLFRQNFDFTEGITKIVNNYKLAIEKAEVKRVVHLSSIGAHTNKGNGMLVLHYIAEQILNQLPADVSIKFMRPVGFYYNMFSFIPAIKNQGSIIQNYGGDDKIPWVAPVDIATVIAEEMEKSFNGKSVRYIASDEISPNALATLLGNAIGRPDLKWTVVPDEQYLNNLIKAGMHPDRAKGFVEMQAGMRGNELYQDYERNRPVLGKTKLTEFAPQFAEAFKRS